VISTAYTRKWECKRAFSLGRHSSAVPLLTCTHMYSLITWRETLPLYWQQWQQL
jgi:hypothetical protein